MDGDEPAARALVALVGRAEGLPRADGVRREEAPRKHLKCTRIIAQDDEDDDENYVIMHVKAGPKGMTERVRMPKHLSAD